MIRRMQMSVISVLGMVMAGNAMALYPELEVAEHMKPDELTVVLKPSDELSRAFQSEESGTLRATWSPALVEISTAEVVIQKKLDEMKVPLATKWQNYMRQYIGLSDHKGNTYIYGNFFCESHGDWHKSLQIVMDGGDCYFQATVDMQQQTIKTLYINGEA